MNEAERVASRLREKWQAALKEKDEALAYAVSTKTSMPANYWRDEWLARQKLIAASALVDALDFGGEV